MERVIYLSVFISFLATWVITQKWIRKAPEIGLMGWDMNKPGRPKVAEMGGICIIYGFVLGLLAYVGLMTFCFGSNNYVPILAALCTVLMTCIIGMMDDLPGGKMGLKQWLKPIFTPFAAGRSSAMISALGMVGALMAFIYYKGYPARIFPGNTMTHSVGALVASRAVLGELEKIAVLLFVPYAIDFLIQIRSNFKAAAFAKVNEEGSLDKPFKGTFI